MNLSSKQREVLERLNQGEKLVWFTNFSPSVSWFNKMERVHFNTIFALQQRGFLLLKRQDWRSLNVFISKAGKEALEEAK